MMWEPIRMGLVGTGPWAELVHAPMLAAGPETELVGVWTRRPDAAGEFAQRHGVVAFDSFEALLDACEGVAFAVPPAAQAAYAMQAAAAGKALLLEKPIASSFEEASRLADAIDDAGVISMVTLTYRYANDVRDFVSKVRGETLRGGRCMFLTNASLEGPFATEWRRRGGAISDVGPHAIDLLQATMGEVVAISAASGPRHWTAVTLEHVTGAVTQASVCSHYAGDSLRIELDLYGERFSRTLDVTKAMGSVFGEAIITGARPLADAEAFATLRTELAHAVRTGQKPDLDVRYGAALQRLTEAASRSIETGERMEIR